jgi:lipopolysaccharide export system protein LptA
MKIAEALLLRKQLEAKVKQLEPLKMQGDQGLFELQTKRTSVSENVDNVQLQIPKITLDEVTADYDHYATQLRKLDASIQKANWEFDVDYKEVQKTKK